MEHRKLDEVGEEALKTGVGIAGGWEKEQNFLAGRPEKSRGPLILWFIIFVFLDGVFTLPAYFGFSRANMSERVNAI